MPHLVIPGGSGFLGLALAHFFSAKDWKVTILSRQKKKSEGNITFVQWDGETLGEWAATLDGADAVVNMAGRSVNCRYTPKNRAEILNSRILSTRVLGKAIAQAHQPPKVWINSSSATIYKDTRGAAAPNDEYLGAIGDDFSMNVCKAWEQEFEAAVVSSTRQVALRTAIVIAHEPGGALEYLINLTKLGLGGTQGSGNQFVSWVHIHDFVRIVDFLIQQQDVSGVVNCAAPNPVTNRFFMTALRTALGRRFGMPLPRFLLQIGAIILQTQTELVLKSRKVVSTRLKEEGFIFEFNTIEEALNDICK